MNMFCGGFDYYTPYTREQMKILHTRQLLKELRWTYKMGCPHCWCDEDWRKVHCYRDALRAELSTREHIPNKKESKELRKARKKKGN